MLLQAGFGKSLFDNAGFYSAGHSPQGGHTPDAVKLFRGMAGRPMQAGTTITGSEPVTHMITNNTPPESLLSDAGGPLLWHDEEGQAAAVRRQFELYHNQQLSQSQFQDNNGAMTQPLPDLHTESYQHWSSGLHVEEGALGSGQQAVDGLVESLRAAAAAMEQPPAAAQWSHLPPLADVSSMLGGLASAAQRVAGKDGLKQGGPTVDGSASQLDGLSILQTDAWYAPDAEAAASSAGFAATANKQLQGLFASLGSASRPPEQLRGSAIAPEQVLEGQQGAAAGLLQAAQGGFWLTRGGIVYR